MRRLAVSVMAAAGLAACATTPEPAREPGQSFFQTRGLEIEDVERVVVTGPFKVMITADAAAPGVSLSGPPEMLADTVVEVDEETLSIRFKEGSSWGWITRFRSSYKK